MRIKSSSFIYCTVVSMRKSQRHTHYNISRAVCLISDHCRQKKFVCIPAGKAVIIGNKCLMIPARITLNLENKFLGVVRILFLNHRMGAWKKKPELHGDVMHNCHQFRSCEGAGGDNESTICLTNQTGNEFAPTNWQSTMPSAILLFLSQQLSWGSSVAYQLTTTPKKNKWPNDCFRWKERKFMELPYERTRKKGSQKGETG